MSNVITIEFDDIDNYEIDEAANSYPMLTEKEHKRLVKDIKVNGQRQPVVVFGTKIIDGRNRVKAIRELGKNLDAIVVESSYEDALKLANSYNDKRRHMSKSQFAMKAAYGILASRVNEDGTPKPKTEWLEVQKAQEVKDKIVGSRNVATAVKIAINNPLLAKDVFSGAIELANAMRQLGSPEVRPDVNVEYFKSNPAASKNYNEYIAKGVFSKQELAKKLVEAELELEKLRKQ